MIPRCPNAIFSLFDREETKAQGRAEAVRWMMTVVPHMKIGDRIIIPNPDTGEPMDYTKAGDMQQ